MDQQLLANPQKDCYVRTAVLSVNVDMRNPSQIGVSHALNSLQVLLGTDGHPLQHLWCSSAEQGIIVAQLTNCELISAYGKITNQQMPDSTAMSMKTDLPGRIENLRVSRRQILQPLFEAVSNSLQSIAKAEVDNGYVRVEIIRDTTQRSLSLRKDGQETRGLDEIVQIRITDNGHGFTDEDLDSFSTLDSRHKASIGGKGVGRLVWLKVFGKVSVESTYQSSTGEYFRRRFRFVLPGGVTDLENARTDISSTSTTVTLSGPQAKYASDLRYRCSTIRDEIIRHFLFQLQAEKPPAIEVCEGRDTIRIDVDDLPENLQEQFELKGRLFTVDHFKIKTPEARDHMIFYCADRRVVKSEKFKDLPKSRFEDTDSTPFYYQAYVASGVLDESVNQERTDFILSKDHPDLADELSLFEIKQAVESYANKFLVPFLKPLQQKKESRIEAVLNTRLPEYQYVRNYNRAELTCIPIDASEEDIEETIALLHFHNQLSGKRLLDCVVHDMEEHVNFDLSSFVASFDARFETLNRVNQASLASYLLFRKSIIEIFAQILRKTQGKFEREAAVHNLLFPMGKDHDASEAYAEHNLWMIDERLTYASYIASDRPISRHKVLFDTTSRAEPDLALYYNLGFSTDTLDGPLHNVVIVEFKRPGPLNKREEDPYRQVLRYIDGIGKGMRNEKGEKVKGSDSTRF